MGEDIRELERMRRLDTALEQFRAAVKVFFHRSKKPAGSEPTEKELVRDFKRFLHGEIDGRIEIVGGRAHFTAAAREVVDI